MTSTFLRISGTAMRCSVLLWVALATSSASAQHADSLRTRVLQEVVFESIEPEGDTLQNFYRANASATTENILSRMKGFSLIRRGAYGQEPVFRSMQGGQLNVTIDGMKIFGACTDKMDPVTIYVEPQNLSAIQAQSGTQGAEFGSTFGGALNMKLAEPVIRESPVSGQSGLDYQTGAHAVNYFSHMNISARQSAYRVSATYRKAGNYRAGGGQELPYSQYEKINLATSGKWTLGEYDTLRLNALVDQGDNLGFPALPMDVGRATAGIFSLTYHRSAPLYFFHHLTTKVYHNEIAHRMDDSRRKDIAMHMDMPGKSQTSGIFVEGEISIFHGHRTRIKAEYVINRLIGEMTMIAPGGAPMYMQTAPRSRRQNAALFISHHLRFNNKNKVEISFRGDLLKDHLLPGTGRQEWEVFFPGLAPSSFHFAGTLSMYYDRKLARNVRLEAQAGYGQRPPTLNERYGYYLFNRFDGYDYLGNPDLMNETSWSAETTLSYFGEAIECQITPYYQQIRHYIMGEVRDGLNTMTPGALGVKQNSNRQRAALSGVDAMVLARPLPALQAVTTIKYTYGRDMNGAPLPLIPPLKIVNSLRYDIATIHVQAEYEWAAAQNRINPSAGEQKTASWTTLALRTGWSINSFLQCNAGVENLFDKNYREHLDWGGIPRQGRNFYLNAVYTFKTTR